MTDYSFPSRLFADADVITRIGEGLLARALRREDWTHEAHLAACTWLVRCRPDIDAETALPGIITAYNEAVGGVNDDHHGYHQTLTQVYLAGVRAHGEDSAPDEPLVSLVNRLIESPRGRRDWPLHFYSKPRLFSVFARRYFTAPDVCAFADAEAGWTCRPLLAPMEWPIDMEGLDYGNA